MNDDFLIRTIRQTQQVLKGRHILAMGNARRDERTPHINEGQRPSDGQWVLWFIIQKSYLYKKN